MQTPLAWDAFQAMHASVLKRQARAGNEVLNCAGDEHLVKSGRRGYAGSDVHCDAAHEAAVALDLARVDAAAERKSEPGARRPQRKPGADRTGRPVKERQQSVSCAVDLAAA